MGSFVDQDIIGLEIAMADPRGMKRSEGGRDLSAHSGDIADGTALCPFMERFAGHAIFNQAQRFRGHVW